MSDEDIELGKALRELNTALNRIAALEQERAELWNQRDAAFRSWQPLTAWDNLRKEKDKYKAMVEKIQEVCNGTGN